jgi:cyclin A
MILKFDLKVQTSKSFLNYYLKLILPHLSVDPGHVRDISNHLAEITLVEYTFVKFRPSLIAVSILALVLQSLGESRFLTSYLLKYMTISSLYKTEECAKLIYACHLQPCQTKLRTIHRKYQLPVFEGFLFEEEMQQ